MRKHLHKTALAFLLIAAASYSAKSQSVPSPAPAQEIPIILKNATIHIGNGEVLKNADILIDNGKITEIGKVTTTFKRSKNVDCTGKHIYPGLIATNTTLGLREISQVHATSDHREAGRMNPNNRAIIAYNTDSRVIPTVRSNGILISQIVPRGGTFSGTSAILQMDAWNWEDAAMVSDDGVWMSWPNLSLSATAKKKDRKKRLKQIEKDTRAVEDMFDAAEVYKAGKEAKTISQTDLKYEALLPVLNKKRTLFIRANTEKQIRAAVEFATRRDVNVVVVGGAEAAPVASLLKAAHIPVILQKTHSLPSGEDVDIDMPFKLPSILKEQGVSFCISAAGFWQQRNLPFMAGTAAAYGLTKEEALRAVTLEAAKILGIDNQCGSLEVGKDGTLVVSAGDLLDMRTSKVEMALIQGREINLGNKQKDLYLKFREKYLGKD